MIGKGAARQALTQIGGMVTIGNEIQTNQKASSGTRKVVVTVGKGRGDQTKTAMRSSSASEDSGKEW